MVVVIVAVFCAGIVDAVVIVVDDEVFVFVNVFYVVVV